MSTATALLDKRRNKKRRPWVPMMGNEKALTGRTGDDEGTEGRIFPGKESLLVLAATIGGGNQAVLQ
jgi:hypothetical protein